jgi:hypothetical protein
VESIQASCFHVMNRCATNTAIAKFIIYSVLF